MLKKNKPLFISIVSVLTLVCLISVFVFVWFFGDSYKDFENDFNKTFLIEDWDSGMVPQGLANSNSNKYVYISAYMQDGSPSRLYVYERTTVDGTTDYLYKGYVTMNYGTEKTFLADEYLAEFAGTAYAGHAGGVCTDGTKMWIAGCDGYVYVMELADVKAAYEDFGEVTFTDAFAVDNRADFCYYYSSTLYVGEFYRSGKYETEKSHYYDKNKAIYLAFDVNNKNSRGVEDVKPEYAVSIPNKIQGMAIANGYIVLSQSYAMSNSHVYIYDDDATKSANSVGTMTINYGTSTADIPLYCVNDYLLKDYKLPAMSEGMCVYGSNVYIMFENNSTKYKAIAREKNEYVYSFTPSAN